MVTTAPKLQIRKKEGQRVPAEYTGLSDKEIYPGKKRQYFLDSTQPQCPKMLFIAGFLVLSVNLGIFCV